MVATSGRSAACVVVAALLGSACGLPADGQASPVTSVPYGLLDTNTPVTEAVVSDESTGGHIVPVWVLAGDSTALAPIERPTEEKNPTLQQAYDALVIGPNEAELADNPDLKTEVPATLGAVLPDDPIDGLLTIVIDTEFNYEDTPERNLITAQLVCTFMYFSSVEGVEIVKGDGTQVPLTSFDFTTIDGPASRSHFNDCLPPEPVEPDDTELDNTEAEGDA